MIDERPRGAVGHGAAYCPAFARYAGVESIVQIILSVRGAADVGGIHAAPAPVCGVVALFVYDALVPPIAKVVCRGRPRDVVVHAKSAAVEPVVGAVDVHPAVKDVRFAVGDIFPARQIGIECLIFHFHHLTNVSLRAKYSDLNNLCLPWYAAQSPSSGFTVYFVETSAAAASLTVAYAPHAVMASIAAP